MVLQKSKAPEIEPEKWLNTEPINLEDGVYLIDFWSYTCPDCSKAFKQLSNIHEETEAEVLGVHAPLFGFEHEDLEGAIERNEVEMPVAADGDKSIWKDYGNRERPRQVIVKDGKVAWKNAGDSRSMREALKDVLEVGELPELDLEKSHSPMIELGYSNIRSINGGENFKGQKTFQMPQVRNRNRVYLSGKWRHEENYLEALENSTLKVNLEVSDVGIVADSEDSSEISLEIDSEEPEEAAGKDLENSHLEIEHPDLYDIVDMGESRQVELTLRCEKGVRLYGISTAQD